MKDERGFDAYKRDVNSTSTAVSQYTSSTLGAGVRYGVRSAMMKPSITAWQRNKPNWG